MEDLPANWPAGTDPWQCLFELARQNRPEGYSFVPLFDDVEDAEKIEQHFGAATV